MNHNIKKRKESCEICALRPGDEFTWSGRHYSIVKNTHPHDNEAPRFSVSERRGENYRSCDHPRRIIAFCHDTKSLGAFQKDTHVKPRRNNCCGVLVKNMNISDTFKCCSGFYMRVRREGLCAGPGRCLVLDLATGDTNIWDEDTPVVKVQGCFNGREL